MGAHLCLIQYSLHGVLGSLANSRSHGQKTYWLLNLMLYYCVQKSTLPEPYESTRHPDFLSWIMFINMPDLYLLWRSVKLVSYI